MNGDSKLTSDATKQVAQSSPAVGEITAVQRAIAASAGAVVTSFFVTPFDVVKTRMQLAAKADSSSDLYVREVYGNNVQPTPRSRVAHPGRVTAMARHERLFGCASFRQAPGKRTAIATMRRIVRSEGAGTLWRGLAPTLVMALPSSALYFSAYEELKGRLQKHAPTPWVAAASPLLAGMLARTLAVSVVSPLEVLRTNMQSSKSSSIGSFGQLFDRMRTGDVGFIFRGLRATLLRDVPFSAIYWMSYEQFRGVYDRLLGGAFESNFANAFSASFAAGASAGTIAATITTPFDVVKTRQQVLVGAQASLPKRPTTKAGIHSVEAKPFTQKPLKWSQQHGRVTRARIPRRGPLYGLAGCAGSGGSSRWMRVPAMNSLATAPLQTSARRWKWTSVTSRFASDASQHKQLTNRHRPILGVASRRAAAINTAVSHVPRNVAHVLQSIYLEEGLRGLFAGLGPRLAKVAPACAIMISSYEVGKLAFRQVELRG